MLLLLYMETPQAGRGGLGTHSIITPGGEEEARRWLHLHYQPPSRSSKMFMFHVSKRQPPRTWTPGTGGTAHEHTQRPSYPCADSTCCQTRFAVSRHLACFPLPKQPNKCNPWTGRSHSQQLLPNFCFLLSRCCVCSSHLNLQPSAPLLGMSVKNCPKICFSSALNVFPIKSRCEKLKEQFSGLNKMT